MSKGGGGWENFRGRLVSGGEGRMRTDGDPGGGGAHASSQRRSLSFLIDPVTQYTWPHSAASLPPPCLPTAPFRSYPAPARSTPPPLVRSAGRIALLLLSLCVRSRSFHPAANTVVVASLSSIYLYAVSPLLPSPPPLPLHCVSARGLFTWSLNTRSPWVKPRPSPLFFFFLLGLTFFFLI